MKKVAEIPMRQFMNFGTTTSALWGSGSTFSHGTATWGGSNDDDDNTIIKS